MRPTVNWVDNAVELIDQNLLPREEKWVLLTHWREIEAAIKDMTVRGAPAIGVAAAMGVALAALESPDDTIEAAIEEACEALASTRPTAWNLFHSIARMRKAVAVHSGRGPAALRSALIAEAQAILDEDIAADRELGRLGAALLPEEATVITHCNAGALACGGYGTALGVFRAASEAGKRLKVYADETRPRLQGMRLTAWELMQDGFDVTVMPDGAAGLLMSRGEVTAVVVGADCVAANGDVANKVGTFHLALAARRHGVPFYVAAPTTTLNPELCSGADIPIEERDPREVTEVAGHRVAPEGVKAFNPAFDVTPADLIDAIITERGVFRAPYDFNTL